MDNRSSSFRDKTEPTMGEARPFESGGFRNKSTPLGGSPTGHMESFEPTSDREMVLNEPMKTPLPSDQVSPADPIKISSEGPFSETIKKMNRELAKRISLEDEKYFITKHGELVRKKFTDGLSNDEQKQLDFIRWQMDRIDDARNGEHIDHLTQIVESHEEFAQDLEKIFSKIGVQSPKK